MKHTHSIIFLIVFFVLIFNTNNQSFAQDKAIKEHKWYIGTNPLAIPLGGSIKPEVKRFLPIVAGNEYGANLVGGYFFRQNQNIEGRLSLSNIHQVAFVGQFHLGTNFYFQKRKVANKQKGWYLGGFVKYWDFYNRQTDVHFHSICPYISAGYTFNTKPLLFDLRLNQTLAVYSWSSLEHTRSNASWMLSPWPEFIPVLPTITFTISYKIEKDFSNGNK